MFRFLQRYAAFGGALWITAKLLHDWSVVMSLVTAAGVTTLTWLEWGTRYGYSPLIVVALVTFASLIWIINGVRTLMRQGTPTTPRMSFDYAYGLALEAIHVGKDANDPVSHYQPGVIWRNAGPAALKFHVDDFRVVIGDRTVAPPAAREATIARGCTTTYFGLSFSKRQLDGLSQKQAGTIEYCVRYGHPEHGFLRIVRARLNVTYRIDDPRGSVYLIDHMTDEEIKA